MGFLSILGPALSGIGGIIGSNQQNKQYAQLQQTIQQILGNANKIDNQVEQGVGNLQGLAGDYTSLLPGLASILASEQNGAGKLAPGAASSYLKNAMSPAALAAATGINAGGLTAGATNYLSNPGGTNLSQVTPGALSFYQNEAKTGLDPRVAQNAQDQLEQQFQQSLSTTRNQLAPGQNPSAIERDARNQLLSQSTNLAGNLAGLDQQYRNTGEQGALSAALGLDQQKQQMLTNAAELGTGYNQTVLGNQAAGAGFGQNVLGALQNFIGQGNQLNEFGLSTLGGLGQQQTQLGEYFAGLGSQAGAGQSNPFSAIGSALSGFSGLFGGGGGSIDSFAAPTLEESLNQGGPGGFASIPTSPFGGQINYGNVGVPGAGAGNTGALSGNPAFHGSQKALG